MTEPIWVGDVVPGVLAEVVDRAGHGYQRWAELVAQAGYCYHPIRLAGRVEYADQATGEVRTVYDSEREPDGVLLVPAATARGRPLPAGMRLEVERPELVHADDHLRVAGLDVGAVHQPVQMQDAVLLVSKSGSLLCFQGRDHLEDTHSWWSRSRRPSWLMSSTTLGD